MKKLFKKIVNSEKTKYFWALIVVGAILIPLGVLFMPFWEKTGAIFSSWGAEFVRLVIAAIIVFYLIFYLVKKVKHARYQAIVILTMIEFVLLAVIAIGCVFTQFVPIQGLDACRILGIALWCRGSVEVFRSYYYKQDSSYEYSLWNVVLAIAMITFGTFIFAKPIFDDTLLQWIFSIFMVVCGLAFVILGIIRKPKKVKKS